MIIELTCIRKLNFDQSFDNTRTSLWESCDFLTAPQSFNPAPSSGERAPPRAALLVTDHLRADPLNLLLSPCFREGQSPDVAVRTGDI